MDYITSHTKRRSEVGFANISQCKKKRFRELGTSLSFTELVKKCILKKALSLIERKGLLDKLGKNTNLSMRDSIFTTNDGFSGLHSGRGTKRKFYVHEFYIHSYGVHHQNC